MAQLVLSTYVFVSYSEKKGKIKACKFLYCYNKIRIMLNASLIKELVFSLKSRTFGLEHTNWADKINKFGAFLAKLSAPILVQCTAVSPLSMFSIIQLLFLQKYIHIANIYLGLGFEFEFGPQRIRDLAFVCP